MLMGGLMLVAVLWMVGQNVQRSRYRVDLWRQRDTLVAAAALVTMLVIFVEWTIYRSSLVFYPYPKLDWPSFNPLIGVALLLIAAPALVGRMVGETTYD